MSAIPTPPHQLGSALRVDALLDRVGTAAGTPRTHSISAQFGTSAVNWLSLLGMDIGSLPKGIPEYDKAARSGSLSDPVTAAFNPSDTNLTERLIRHHELSEIKRILRHGTNEANGKPIYPYQFRDRDGRLIGVADAAGLEGFIFSEKKFSAKFGEEASIALLQNYFHYTLTLLNGARKTQEARERIQHIRDSSQPDDKKYFELISFLRSYVGDLQRMVLLMDQAHWSLSARMYHIYIRPFNLAQWRTTQGIGTNSPKRESGRFFRDFDRPELDAVRGLSFNAIRWMGTFPTGSTGAKGTGGGSPFAAKRFEVDGSLGTKEEVAKHVRIAASRGMRTIFELVLNHTSIDSELLRHNPILFVHTRIKPDDHENYYRHVSDQHGEFWIRYGGHRDECTGQRAYFKDTLQLDLTNSVTRDLMIAQTKDLIRNYGIQGFRVDMAYKLRNDRFRDCWGDELSNPQSGQREFLEELITSVKVAFPGVAFIAEAFAGWDELSTDGFDLIYGLDDMDLKGGGKHLGWHSSLMSRDPQKIRDAIQRAEFLHWQTGGADMLAFWGQHDKPAFWKIFGDDWKWGAALLTLMRPGALNVLASTEAQFEDPCEEDQKVITFNRPTKINWQGTEEPFGKFQIETLKCFANLEKRWGNLTFELLPTPPGEHWVGYVIKPFDAPKQHPKVLVVVNPTHRPTQVNIKQPESGICIENYTLKSCGPEGNEIFYLK